GGDRHGGLVIEWTGTSWTAPALPPGTGMLWWCWVDGKNTAWAVGERGTVLRRDPRAWSLHDTRGAVDRRVTLFGVWGTTEPDASQVWVVGGALGDPSLRTAIARYDGDRWHPEDPHSLPPYPLFKVWGAAADDVWAVGAAGTALHHDGTRWSSVDPPTSARLLAAWGAHAMEGYA